MPHSRPAGSRALPARPRPVRVASAVTGVLVLVAGGLVASTTPAVGTRELALTVQLTVSAALVLVCARVVAGRARSGGTEGQVWTWVSRSLLVVGAGVLTQAVLTALPLLGVGPPEVSRGLRDAVLSLTVLAATPLTYRGLVRWNRFTTVAPDPGDWLNGLGAVFVMTAVGDLVLPWASSPLTDWPWWQLQLWLLRSSSVLMLVGSAVVVGVVGGRLRDRRVWSIAGALLLVAVVDNALVLPRLVDPGLDGWPATAWVVAGAAVVAASGSTTAPVPARAAGSQAPAVGALVVLLAGVAVIVACTRMGATATTAAVVLATTSVLGISTRVVALVRSLAQVAQHRAEALTDDLTGLPNRQALTAALVEATSAGRRACLLVVDLDGFQGINDRFGHRTGDELLRVAASTIEQEVRGRGLTARLGGDEFAVLFPDAGVDLAVEVAHRLGEVTRHAVTIGGRRLLVRGSLGVAATDQEDTAPTRAPGPAGARAEWLLVQATTALQIAKADGGHQLRVYDEQVAELLREESRRLEELRALLGSPDAVRGVHAGRLVVHYQPQVDLRTGRVLGAEALVRWENPRLGLVGPDAFLDLVEQNGLMDQLTEDVLRQAAGQAVAWRESGMPLRVSVNLSAGCLADASLLHLLDDVLRETTLDPQDLVLEVTETSLMADPSVALAQVREIADRGVGISIDDYGTGYSSLGYLNDLPATELKIDRSFTARLTSDARTVAIVAATVTLGHHLGLRLVAEGVEDEATLGVVRDLGCDEVQGYVHSRPLPADSFARWLLAHEAARPLGAVPGR